MELPIKINNLQRIDEWINIDDLEKKYHSKQWFIEKRSTVVFETFCKHKVENSNNIIDLGSGSGAPTYYFAKKNNKVFFTGCDISQELIEIGISKLKEAAIDNLKFKKSDWFNLDYFNDIDGVISLQTISWMPEFETPFLEIFTKVNPKWIALTSLFYEGNISAITEINEHTRNRKSFYNTYSLKEIDRFCRKYGYYISKAIPFNIDIDLPKSKDDDLMSTYTHYIGELDRRIQLCGPIIMNWKMIMIERI